jgi:anti-sigma regulatory factor (Ser/Thr protein kinase)
MTTVSPRRREPQEERRDLELHASLTALREARAVIRHLDGVAPYPDLCFVAELLTTELVSNVLRHAGIQAGEPFRINIDCDADTLRVEVHDSGAGFDPLALLRIHSTNDGRHRGIFLIHALADRWGSRRDHGCCLWFELDLIPGRRPWRGRERIPRKQ